MSKTIFAFTLMFASSLAFAGSYPGDFQNLGVGARATGFDSTFISLADDASDVYWNPAGLPGLIRSRIALGYVQLFQDTDYSNVAANFHAGKKTGLGFSWSRTAVKNIELTDLISSDSLGTVNTAQDCMILGAGYKLGEKISVGLSGKYLSQSLGDYKDTGYSSDIGMLLGGQTHRFAFVLKDIYGASGGENIPASYLVGWTWSGFWEKKPAEEEEIYAPHMMPRQMGNQEQDKFNIQRPETGANARVEVKREPITIRTHFNMAVSYSPERDNQLGAGESFECWINDSYALRAGFEQSDFTQRQSNINGMTLGGSIRFDRMGLDYSYKYYDRLDGRHYITLSYYI